MVTLKFTRKDYEALLMLLGFGMGAHAKTDAPAPQAFKEVVDWTLIQGGNDQTYCYYHDKNRLREQKEAELAGERATT